MTTRRCICTFPLGAGFLLASGLNSGPPLQAWLCWSGPSASHDQGSCACDLGPCIRVAAAAPLLAHGTARSLPGYPVRPPWMQLLAHAERHPQAEWPAVCGPAQSTTLHSGAQIQLLLLLLPQEGQSKQDARLIQKSSFHIRRPQISRTMICVAKAKLAGQGTCNKAASMSLISRSTQTFLHP